MKRLATSHPQLIHRCGQLCRVVDEDEEVALVRFPDGEERLAFHAELTLNS